MYQLLLGTAYCHVRGVVHRDLKPQNLLVDRKGVLKVADFGLARAVYIPMKAYTHEVVTLWYRAPEILLGQHVYSYGVDVWSIGAIFAELLNNAPLWPGAYELDQLLRIFRTLGTPTEETWSGLAELPDYTPAFPSWAARPLSAVCPTLDAAGLDLLGRMLAYNPAARISCRAALEHPWFDDVDASAKVRYM
jgi:serine/threonine protein kinase